MFTKLFHSITCVVVLFLVMTTIAVSNPQPLPLKLSQNEWVNAKQEIQLATGIKVKYVEMGQRGKETLILLHGMTDNSRSWSLIAPYFTDKYHVLIIDQRGHGDSDKPDFRMYAISDYASDLASFMQAKNIKQAHIVGHSLGSMIAQTFAVNYPEKVNKIVLEASALVEFNSLGRGIYDDVLKFGNKNPDDEFMAAWYTNPNPVDMDFLNREMKESQNIPPHAWRAITKGAAFSNLMPFMDELKSPVLILWGDADGFFSKEAQEALHKSIPQAKFITYKGVGHNIQWEIPEKMAKDIKVFLK